MKSQHVCQMSSGLFGSYFSDREVAVDFREIGKCD